MSWAIDQGWKSDFLPGSGTTLTLTYDAPVASGALLVAFIAYVNAVTVTAVSDSVNGAWTPLTGTGIPADAIGGAAGNHMYPYAFPNSAPGTPTITVTLSGTADVRTMVAGSYTGIATTSFYDVGKGNGQEDPGTGADAVTTGATGTTAGTNELAIAAMFTGAGTAVTSAASWTQRFNADISSNYVCGVQDKNIASPSTVTATWTINNAGADPFSIVVTFKELSVAGATVLMGDQLN